MPAKSSTSPRKRIDSNRRLRIAMFHFGFFYSGGGEKLVLEEIRGLKNLGHDVTCFAPYVDREGCFPDWPEINQVVSLLPHPPRWLPLSHAIWVLACCLLIPLMAPRFRSFDVLFGANQPAPWLTCVLGKLLGKPYAIYLAQPLRLLYPRAVDRQNGLRIHDGDQRFVRILTKYASSIINWADQISVHGAGVVLTNGRHVGQWIEGIYQVKTVDCPAGCHPNAGGLEYARRLSGQVSVNGTAIDKPYALLTNRHSPMKRFEYGLWAMKHLVRTRPEVRLVISGQPTEYTAMLKYLADGLGLTERVVFVGLVSEAELRQLYSEAALYIYTSPEEDFGMGVIEAMAAGTPVVAWNTAGPTVTVENNVTGFLVPPYESDLFAEKMQLLLSRPGLASRMGQAAHRRALTHFSYERHCTLLENALTDLACQERRTRVPDGVSSSVHPSLVDPQARGRRNPAGLPDTVALPQPAEVIGHADRQRMLPELYRRE